MKGSRKVLRNRKGFTLIELIVVLAVLAIIMAIAVPRFIGVQESAKVDADYSTGAMIAKAVELYIAQNEDVDVESINNGDLQLSAVSFKSSKIVGQTIDDVTFEVTAGTGEIKVSVSDTGGTDYQLYPIPPERDLENSGP